MDSERVYLDYNATTPVDPRVLETMLPYFTSRFGNASSRSHVFGWDAAGAVDEARARVANLVGCKAQEIVFTSGATEAANLALKGVFETYKARGNHIITIASEHSSVLDSLRYLELQGAEVTLLPVNSKGLISLGELEEAFRATTILVSVMFANNETGVIQPVKEIAEIAHRHEALFFSDATQAVGKVPVLVDDQGIDLMAFSAHKMYGPKGVGALFVRRKNPRVKVMAQMNGGGHERGMRSGTLNVPGIVGFGMACELSLAEMKQDAEKQTVLRDRLEQGLLKMEETYVNGDTKSRMPNVSNIMIKHVESAALLSKFNTKLAISTGSACSSSSPEPSHVLKAMGLCDRDSRSSLRISLGRFTTGEEVDIALDTLELGIRQAREESPRWEMFKEGKDMSEIG